MVNTIHFNIGQTFIQGALIAQLSVRRAANWKIAGSILTWGTVLSLSKTLHPYCLVMVKPRKPYQND